jgi:hypothetical protein
MCVDVFSEFIEVTAVKDYRVKNVALVEVLLMDIRTKTD